MLSFIFIALTTILGVATILQIGTGIVFATLVATAVTGASLILLIELLLEGERTGVLGREFKAQDVIAGIIGVSGLVFGTWKLAAVMFDIPLVQFSPVVNGILILLLPILITVEIATK